MKTDKKTAIDLTTAKFGDRFKLKNGYLAIYMFRSSYGHTFYYVDSFDRTNVRSVEIKDDGTPSRAGISKELSVVESIDGFPKPSELDIIQWAKDSVDDYMFELEDETDIEPTVEISQSFVEGFKRGISMILKLLPK